MAAMVMKRLLELNSDRQAFFLVETDARAMQKVNKKGASFRGVLYRIVKDMGGRQQRALKWGVLAVDSIPLMAPPPFQGRRARRKVKTIYHH